MFLENHPQHVESNHSHDYDNDNQENARNSLAAPPDIQRKRSFLGKLKDTLVGTKEERDVARAKATRRRQAKAEAKAKAKAEAKARAESKAELKAWVRAKARAKASWCD